MITVTATTQAELDAALADSATEYIEVHSPATDELTIDTDRTDVAISIRGESVIRGVRGSATIRGVSDSATIRDVADSATIRDVADSATIRDVWGSATIRGVAGSATIRGVWGSATIRGVAGSATIRGVAGSATIRGVSDSATIRDVRGSATISGVWGSATISGVWDSATISGVWDSATISDVADSATISGVRGSATISDVADSATIRDVADSATIRDVRGGCAIVGVYDTATLRQIGPHVSVHLYSTQATVDGGHVIDLTGLNLADPAVWCEHNGVRVDSDDLAHMYKAVDDEYQAGHNYLPTIYRVGADVAAPDWQDTHECGNGLHVSPRLVQARSYYPAATRFLEVTAPVVDLRPIDATKAKTRSVHVLREVDINGDPLEVQA